MKTITLTDEAYERLKDWKLSGQESFSHVVLSVVPKRGALSDLVESFRQLPPLTEREAEIMTESVRSANDWGNEGDVQDSWPAELHSTSQQD